MAEQASRHGMRWTPEEHQLFIHALQMHPLGKWEEIASVIGTRTPRQTRKHAEKLQEKIKRHQKRAADTPAGDATDDDVYTTGEDEIALIEELLRARSRTGAQGEHSNQPLEL